MTEMAYQADYGDQYAKTTEARRDTISDAAEQLYKELAVLQELADKIRGRLNPVMAPGTPRDDSAKLSAVNNSSPFVGQLFDMRGGCQNVVAVLMDIDNRLTL